MDALRIAKEHSDHAEGFDYLYGQVLEVAKTLPWGLPFVEIGTRAGGSALLFLQAIKESGISRPLITVDPYGKDYLSSNETFRPIGEARYRQAMKLLADYCAENDLTHIHYRMTSEYFIENWHKTDLWIAGEVVSSLSFAFVYLDGEHTEETVSNELRYFSKRMYPDNALMVIDDIEHIDYSKIHETLKNVHVDGNRLYAKIRLSEQEDERKPTSKPLPENNNRPRFAVVTIAVGDTYERMAEMTHPTLRRYADKIGADFIVISESTCSTPHWEKFQLYDLFEKYDRIIYLDTDLIVREDCPNLFDMVPPEKLGAFNELPFVDDRMGALKEACLQYDLKIPDWNGKYLNTGVMVLSKSHRHLFRKPDKEIFNFYEQSYLNAVIGVDATPIYELPYKFNRMCCMGPYTGEERYASYIIHYAGLPSYDAILTAIRHDTEIWDIDGPEKRYQRHILIDVQGGLGDQVCAEPAIRFAIDKIWPGEDVQIKSHWPTLYRHLRDRATICHHLNWHPQQNTEYYHANTLPGPNMPQWSIVSNLLCHTVDYSAMAIWKRILPTHEKRVRLDVTKAGMKEAMKVAGQYECSAMDMEDLVLIHAGWHWESKTLPQAWWQELVDKLDDQGLEVCLIGKNEEETRGVLPLSCPDGVVDARDKLSLDGLIALISRANVLISNDSAPIHIAGAFDNHIILIPSCKHQDHILPWRHGRQSWRAQALCKREMTYDFASAPTEINPPNEINGQFVPPGMTWDDYLPNPQEVVDVAIKAFDRETETVLI